VPLILRVTERDNELRHQVGVLLALVTLIPIVLWVADLFGRLVNINVVPMRLRAADGSAHPPGMPGLSRRTTPDVGGQATMRGRQTHSL
jgi:hypothetical protein